MRGILAQLYGRPDRRYYVREIARAAGTQPSSLQRDLARQFEPRNSDPDPESCYALDMEQTHNATQRPQYQGPERRRAQMPYTGEERRRLDWPFPSRPREPQPGEDKRS